MIDDATLGPRERKKLRVRDALVASANTLFRVHGYGATTIDQIAEGAGVSRRTYFRYFPTKDAVVFPQAEGRFRRFVVALNRDVQGADVPAGAGQSPDIWASLRRAFTDVAADYAKDSARLLFQTRLIASEPALVARDQTLDRRWEEAVAEALISHDVARDRREAQLRAGAIMGAFRAAFRQWILDDGKSDLLALGERAVTLLRRGFEG